MSDLPELPPRFQKAFEAAKAKAELEYATRAERFPHHPQFADASLHRLILIQKVFFALCTQARNACREGDWTVAGASRAIDAAWPFICDSYFVRERGACSEEDRSRFRVALWRTITDDHQWKQHLSDLAALAEGASASEGDFPRANQGGAPEPNRDESTRAEADPAVNGANGNMTDQRAAIDAFISKLAEAGRRITRKNVWTVAGYTNATEFERFQRCDTRTTQSAAAAFNRVLSMKPADFIRLLDRKPGSGSV